MSRTTHVQRQTRAARTADDVKAILSFTGIDDAERLRLMNIVLDQFWVAGPDEEALERIWGSMDEDGLVRFADAHPGKWEECIRRGADLIDIEPYRAIREHFRNDITALATHYLNLNESLVNRELAALGSGAPPTADQAVRLAGLQASAASLVNLQRAQEAAREAVVGWRLGDGGDIDPDWTGRQVKYQVRFQPGAPPPLIEEPADVPSGDIFLRRVVPYGDVQQGYDEASAAIRHLVTDSPALYGLVRGGSADRTEAFVNNQDAGSARESVSAPLRRVLTDIRATRGYLGRDLDPLDLDPLIQQLYAGQAAVGGALWIGGFRRRVAYSSAVGHAIDRALPRLALQYVQQLAFMFAPFTSGASLLVLLGTGAAAAGVQAYGSYREAQRAGVVEGAAVQPGSELVAPGTAERARLTAEADLVAFGLALLTLGAEGFAAWRTGAQARRATATERLRLSHGTDQGGLEGLGGTGGGRIDVTRAAGSHQDLGQGFYLSLDQETAGVYAFRRGQQRGGGMQHVMTFEVPASDLGVVVDIRRGGNFRRQWEAFLEAPPPFPGNRPIPGFETNRSLLARAPEQRGAVFDRFLDGIGMRSADTVIAPLGDDVFTGITSGAETSQVCIRTQRVADRLNAQIRTGQ